MPMPKLEHLNCSRGAPMGRRSILSIADPDTFNGRVMLQAMLMVDGAYDQGGAYWGGWSLEHGGMWRFYYQATEKDATADDAANFIAEDDVIDAFTRAKTREQAKAWLLDKFPQARFYK